MRSGCHWRKNLQLLVLSVLAGVLGFGSTYAYTYYLTSIPAGAVLWGHDLSGMNRVAAEDLVQRLVDDWQQREVQVIVNRGEAESQVEPLTVSELGFVYDVPSTVEKLFDLSLLEADLLSAHGSAVGGVEPVVRLQEAVLKNVLVRFVSYEEAPQDAQVVLDEERGEWIFQEHQTGFGLSVEQQLVLAEQIRDLAVDASPDAQLEVSLGNVSPVLDSVDVEPLYQSVQELLAKKVTWPADGHMVMFSLLDYPWLIEVDHEAKEVRLSDEALARYVDDWAEVFDRDRSVVKVGEAQLQERGYLKAPFDRIFEEGRMLNRAKMVRQLMKAFGSEEQEVVLELPYVQEASVVVMPNGEELTLISQGRSSYKLGNGADRIYNVQFGLGKYDGVVLPQGAEFSFNDVLGWVRYEDGWKPALAIFGGGGVRKVPGGGLCQVSTTVYRAAVHSGLPITKRKPHSLDVSYYHEYGYGIDATIYPPADVDLRFVNDTPGTIVVHTYTDPAREEAFVEFYGVDDGREIELEQTINRDVFLPKQLIETDELPAGVQEVEKIGTVGRYIEWDWKVKRADGSVDERIIETLYPGAPKKILVGTGGRY